MYVGIALMILLALFMLVPGGYWVVNPTVPGWVKPWMLWPLKGTSRRVLRMQGWAGVLIGIAILMILAALALRTEILFLLAVVVYLVALVVWAISLAISFSEAKRPTAPAT
ncbi:MAG TPA: hypothetical protein VF134_01080 [Candidatus Dormibacteraeota bacterium]